MTTPTKKEAEWLKKLEELLCNPPSKRIGFYTTGDPNLFVYDLTKEDQINADTDARECDFCCSVDRLGASMGSVTAAMNIHSTCG